MIAVVWAFILAYWLFVVPLIPTAAAFWYNVHHFGWRAFFAILPRVGFVYAGTLFCLQLAWITLFGNLLLPRDEKTYVFMGLVTVTTFAFFLQRGTTGTPLGDSLQRLLDRALKGARAVSNPLLLPARALEKISAAIVKKRSGMKDNEHTFTKADAAITSIVPHVEMPEGMRGRLLSSSEKCRSALRSGDSKQFGRELHEYCGVLRSAQSLPLKIKES